MQTPRGKFTRKKDPCLTCEFIRYDIKSEINRIDSFKTDVE